jgi:hypothetical protein
VARHATKDVGFPSAKIILEEHEGTREILSFHYLVERGTTGESSQWNVIIIHIALFIVRWLHSADYLWVINIYHFALQIGSFYNAKRYISQS